MNCMKRVIFTLALCLFSSFLFASAFNSNLSSQDEEVLKNGEVLIKKINYSKNMSLKKGISDISDTLIEEIKSLSPKYLAEVIQIRPYKGNENLAEQLNEILNDVSEYAGIPYYSEHSERWYNLYDSATIVSEKTDGNKKYMNANLEMLPFGTVEELIEIEADSSNVLYIATNQNKLRYKDQFDCVWPKKMKMCILLIHEGDNWILYGIGGVNAPRIPFFTERIDTSFMNRITTFCNFIFSKI